MSNRERPRDRHDYELSVAEVCRETFKHHEIIDRSDDGREWCLRRRVNGVWDHDMHCRIRVLGCSALIVHGDFDFCGWEGFYGGTNAAARETTTPLDVVRWIGGTNDPHTSKASRFFDGDVLTKCRVGEVLRRQISDRLADVDEDDEETLDKLSEVIARIDDIDNHDECEGLLRDLYAEDESVIDSEDMGYLGFVTSRRVLRAHAAVARLHQLLEQEKR